jgi:hypothetical protein
MSTAYAESENERVAEKGNRVGQLIGFDIMADMMMAGRDKKMTKKVQ